MFMKKLFACFLLSLILSLPHASGVAADRLEYIAVNNIALGKLPGGQEKWHATAYQDKTGKNPALLCFWKDPNNKKDYCFPAEDDHAPGEKYYSYNEVKKLRIIVLQKSHTPKQGLLFVARNTSFVAGFLTHVSIWSYDDAQQTFKKILPSARITEQGEYKVIPLAKDGTEGLFIKADYIWGEEETRLARHRYGIEAYRLGKDGVYQSVAKYETQKKYNSLDDADSIDVIQHELINILNRIK